MSRVTHHPRVAWDGALAFVGAAGHDDLYGWLDERLGDMLGLPARRALAETRSQLWYSDRPDARNVECGRWRARLLDLLNDDPELVAPMRTLVQETAVRLREVTPRLDLVG
jgi:hypothetical protein